MVRAPAHRLVFNIPILAAALLLSNLFLTSSADQ